MFAAVNVNSTPSAPPLNPFPFPPMQTLIDALTAAALTLLAWIVAVAFLSL
jgi:hypothetical protein